MVLGLARLESGEVGENRDHPLTEGLTQRLDGRFPDSGADLDGYCERRVWGSERTRSREREASGKDRANQLIDRRVVPELQRRGLFRREYKGRTLGENLGLPRPENRFFARRGF
jgi:hypothetical protein